MPLPDHGAVLGVEAEEVAFAAQGVEPVAVQHGGAARTGVFAPVGTAKGVLPHGLSGLGVQAGDDVVFNAVNGFVTHGVEAVALNGHGGVAKAHLGLPGHVGFFQRLGIPMGLVGHAVGPRSPPAGPVIGVRPGRDEGQHGQDEDHGAAAPRLHHGVALRWFRSFGDEMPPHASICGGMSTGSRFL